MALFAHMATPQIRLTKDPNTYFFFLDHLEERSPFRLEDDGTWDTNIERGIYWGLRLVEKDEEIRNASQREGPRVGPTNSQAFMLISDGQAWSGEVAKSLALAQERGIPLNVVGVGTTAGGIIPDPKRDVDAGGGALVAQPGRADRASPPPAAGATTSSIARAIAQIASTIIEQTRRRARHRAACRKATQELYWNLLVAAAVFVGLGVLFLRDRVALALQLLAAGAVLVFVTALF